MQRQYRLLFSSSGCHRKPGPKAPSVEPIAASTQTTAPSAPPRLCPPRWPTRSLSSTAPTRPVSARPPQTEAAIARELFACAAAAGNCEHKRALHRRAGAGTRSGRADCPRPLPAATLHGVCRHRPQAALYRRQLRKPQGPLHKSLYHAPPGIGVPSTALLQRMLATIKSYYGVFSQAHTKDVAAFGDSRSRCPQTAPTEVSAMLACALTARFPVRHLLVALKNMHAGPHCKK